MTSFLCVTVRFLQPYFHGRGDGGEPEWPPSPLRLFQALVAAAGARWGETPGFAAACRALEWLERQAPPTIVASEGQPAQTPYRLYVPDNVGDRVASSWTRGGTDDIANYRTEKDVRPIRLEGEAVHYLYPLPDAAEVDAALLRTAARSIPHLGWGVDMVAADIALLSADEAADLSGERWVVGTTPSLTPRRVPREGTLQALLTRQEAYLSRLDRDGTRFRPVPPLGAYRLVPYRRATDADVWPTACFGLLTPDGERYRPFDTVRRTRDVAAMVRHATAEACVGWPFGDPVAFVHGHDRDSRLLKGADADRRFRYLPLPSIERRGPGAAHVGAIWRVLLTAPPDCRAQVEWVRRRLAGQDLIWNDQPVALLNQLPTADWVVQRYLGASAEWSTVTPVIWPGHDDRSARKAERLLRKAFIDGGLSRELVDGIADLEWRAAGFRPGVDLATRYIRPDKLTGPLYHVRVRFARPIRGPLAVGAGRYRGFGLFAMPD